MTRTDRFGNPIEGELPYARGEILSNTADDHRELAVARRQIRERWDGGDGVFNFSGLERGFPAGADEIESLDDETAPALYGDEFHAAALDHLGGSPDRHDAFLANRMTACTILAIETLAEPGGTAIGVAPNYSHASVVRAVERAGASFVDTDGLAGFETALDEHDASLLVLSRMDVSYEALDADEVAAVVDLARDHDMSIYLDDAGAARVAPAMFDAPRSLELDVDAAATGLDKYGVFGPRFGLLAGDEAIVSEVRSRAWKVGLEARPVFLLPALRSLQTYDPDVVREQVATTKRVGDALDRELGGHVEETSVVVKVTGEELLELAMAEAGIEEPPIVPFEATAALSMLMLRDHGTMTVHFAGVPSGTPDFLLKFLSSDELDRFGGADAFAGAVAGSISELAGMLDDPDEIRELLLG